MRGIIWLASYPKSGNTWLRTFLTNYLRPAESAAPLDALIGEPVIRSRDFLEEWLGISTTELSSREVNGLLPRVYEAMARSPEPWFMKTHECISAPDARFRTATAAVVYLVRNPLDVAVSFAHHEALSLDTMIAAMADPEHTMGALPRGIWQALPERIGSWSNNVRVWVDRGLMPLVVRYEDLLREPERGFAEILRHCGIAVDPGQLARAVAFSQFDALRAQEARDGFKGRPPQTKEFFRAGKAGGWKDVLSEAQAASIARVHGATMARFGYEAR